MTALSPRLQAVVDALPLRAGLRVLEIGCGPGAAARVVAHRVGPDGFVLAIDRSDKAVRQATASSTALIEAGLIAFRQGEVETFALPLDEAPFDVAFAIRVGALDGRHPESEARAHAAIKSALRPGGQLFIDGGDPLRAIKL